MGYQPTGTKSTSKPERYTITADQLSSSTIYTGPVTTTAASTTGTTTYYYNPQIKHREVQTPKAQYGWECPRCGKINAPWAEQCKCNKEYNYTVWTTSTPSVGKGYTIDVSSVSTGNSPCSAGSTYTYLNNGEIKA